MADHQSTKDEAADAYGRHEGCFLDHQKAPFRFKDVARSLEPTRFAPSRKESSGLVTEPGLQVGAFPKTSVDLNEPFGAAGEEALFNLTCVTGNTFNAVSPFISRTTLLRDLQLPLELPDLGSNPANDLEEHRQAVDQKRFDNPFMKWLPITPTNDGEDEGLRFPAKAAKLHSLLLRELDCERIEVSEVSEAFERELKDSVASKAPLMSFEKFGSRMKLFEADPITPPLSPMSEDSHEFFYEPDRKVCPIDLTSEPSSPIPPDVHRLENSIRNGTIESAPSSCEKALKPVPSSPNLPIYSKRATVRLRDLQLDVPLSPTAPSTNTQDDNILKNLGSLNDIAGSDPLLGNGPIESFFDDAFASTLEAHQSNAAMAVEQEQFDPVDSISRISVPALDFTIDHAEWEEHTSSAKSQFIWIQGQQIGQENLAPIPRSVNSESSLKWAPFAPSTGRVSANEALEPLPEETKSLFNLETEPSLNSGSYVARMSGLSIERLGDEELGADEEDLDVPEEAGYYESIFFESRGEPMPTDSSQIGLSSLVSAAAIKRRQSQASGVVPWKLLGSSDGDATSKLLEGFMELRAAKKPRTAPGAKSSAISRAHLPPTPISTSPDKGAPTLPVSNFLDEPEVLTPASAPEASIPIEKGCFVISLSLRRSVLRHIESSWPQDHLIDRDYNLHNKLAWSPGSAQRKAVSSPLSYDADIALTPTVGVIVTTLLKAKQKPLPKSKTLPQLRDRVLRVSQKFEALFVLVSECNHSGEYTSQPHPSDAAAYADFVRFTVSLQAGVTAYFVPGADQTMAKWILSLMCRYTPNALSSKPYLNSVESTWEVFFRRAGMNAFAAQVLAGAALEKGGTEGLARIMASSPQEIIGTFRGVLGGEKGLATLSGLLCTPWGREVEHT